MVHPAPRIMNAPVPKSANILRSGKAPTGAAIAMLQPQGQNNNQLPNRKFRKNKDIEVYTICLLISINKLNN